MSDRIRYTAEILPYHDYPLEIALRELASLGFSEVNLWSAASPLAAHVNPGDDVAGIKAALARHGLRACGLTTYGQSRDAILARLRLAHDLEIGTVIFDCEARYADFVATFLPPLLDEAERLGVSIAVENHLTVSFSVGFLGI